MLGPCWDGALQIHDSVVVPALQQAVSAGRAKAFVILDGTLLSVDRIAADRPYYSGIKHKNQGMHSEVLAEPFGQLL